MSEPPRLRVWLSGGGIWFAGFDESRVCTWQEGREFLGPPSCLANIRAQLADKRIAEVPADRAPRRLLELVLERLRMVRRW